jgi:uncharacterized Fe-S center protein
MARVYFLDYSKNRNILQAMKDLFTKSSLDRTIPGQGSVAVKMHMGELGNITYLRPIFVRRVVDLIKKAGGEPFVTDTTTLYAGGRNTPERYLATAASNGFVEASIGAPVLIADDDGDEGVAVAVESPVASCELRDIRVATRIYHADSLMVLSHVKGHMQTGFGGTIKNLAMGCVTKKSKMAQHAANAPALNESRCDGFGSCVDACPTNALSIVEGKPVRDMQLCTNCSECIFSCPNGALSWPEGAKEQLQANIAHAAWAVLKKFDRRVGFINFIQDVTPQCDCASPAGLPIVQDVGILASLDPVAIDKASLDLIDQAPLIVSPAPARPPDLLGRMHHTDSLVQLRTAERLGLGSLEYRLVTI